MWFAGFELGFQVSGFGFRCLSLGCKGALGIGDQGVAGIRIGVRGFRVGIRGFAVGARECQHPTSAPMVIILARKCTAGLRFSGLVFWFRAGVRLERGHLENALDLALDLLLGVPQVEGKVLDNHLSETN